jgi:uncharacterized protein (TIGR02453 family)
MAIVIEKETLQFLRDLAKHNNREWFSENKSRYLQAQSNVIQFMDELILKMNQHDRLETQSGKESLYRIYNDVRFSNNKTPYNPRFAGNLRRQKPMFRGGYYFWIKPGESRVGCGFTYPNPEDLLRIRQDIAINYQRWKRLLHSKAIQNSFGKMKGEQLKTAPRGFDKDHPAIDLLRHKQFWFEHSFTDKEVMADDFLDQINKTFKCIRPFFNHMSEVLTTDLNGVSRF